MPKSRILTRPSLVMNRLSGFRSRWTMPLSCAAARPSADLARVVDRLARRQRASLQTAAERFALEQLGDDVGRAGVGADIVDGQDVRVVELPGGARFLLEALQSDRVGRERSRGSA